MNSAGSPQTGAEVVAKQPTGKTLIVVITRAEKTYSLIFHKIVQQGVTARFSTITAAQNNESKLTSGDSEPRSKVAFVWSI